MKDVSSRRDRFLRGEDGRKGLVIDLDEVQRLLRDVRMLMPPDGTNEILSLIHGRELTGFAAFR